MALNFTEYYQLGDEEDEPIVFEKDLIEVVRKLGRPRPEFRGAKLLEGPDGVSQWLVQCNIRGRMVFPHTASITFDITEGIWMDGLARAMHEALARLCGAHGAELGSGFRHYARRDTTGRPMEVPSHPDLGQHVHHQDFLLFSTQQELDRARLRAELLDFARVEAEDRVRVLRQERRVLRRQREKKDRVIMRLRSQVADLEQTVADLEEHAGEIEQEGIDLRKERDAFLSDDEDFHEEMDMEEEDDDDDEFIDDADMEPEGLISDEEDPEERVIEVE